MKTEIVELDERFGEEYKGKYVFSEITWAKRSRIIQKYTKYHPETGQIITSDFIGIQAETIWASLRGQPENKPLILEKLLSEDQGIPVELGELLSKVVNKLCGMGRSDIRFLLEQLDEESRIRLFQSFGYAKSSDGLPTNSIDNPLKPSKNSS
jgi:hypothetical protein